MNFIIDDALTAIERERPELAGWCEDKRHELPDQGKLEALRWVVFSLDERNRAIAAKALGIALMTCPPWGECCKLFKKRNHGFLNFCRQIAQRCAICCT